MTMTMNTETCTEALCSANTRLEIGGMSVQVTGRGATAAEMTTNFRASVEALRAEFEATAGPTLAEQVATIEALWLKKAVQRGDLALAQRVLKAATLVLQGQVSASSDQALWHVASQTGTGTYAVTRMRHEDGSCHMVCHCESYTRGVAYDPSMACKHGLAVAMSRKLR